MKKHWFLLLAGLLLAVAPVFVSNFVVTLLAQAAVLAVFAASYDLLLGYTGIFSFGHALFLGIGAYLAALLLLGGHSLLLAVPAAVVLGAVLAAVIGIVTLRTKGVYYAMVTLAFAEMFHIYAGMARITGGDNGLTGIPVPSVMATPTGSYYVMVAFAAVCFGAMYFFLESPPGRVLRAVRDNPTRAAMVGYNVSLYLVAAQVVAAVFASLAGVFLALNQGMVYTDVLSSNTTVNALLIVILGGIGTLYGAALGSLVVVTVGGILANYFTYWPLFLGALYILFVLLYPQGLMQVNLRRLGAGLSLFPCKAARPLAGRERPGVIISEEGEGDRER